MYAMEYEEKMLSDMDLDEQFEYFHNFLRQQQKDRNEQLHGHFTSHPEFQQCYLSEIIFANERVLKSPTPRPRAEANKFPCGKYSAHLFIRETRMDNGQFGGDHSCDIILRFNSTFTNFLLKQQEEDSLSEPLSREEMVILKGDVEARDELETRHYRVPCSPSVCSQSSWRPVVFDKMCNVLCVPGSTHGIVCFLIETGRNSATTATMLPEWNTMEFKITNIHNPETKSQYFRYGRKDGDWTSTFLALAQFSPCGDYVAITDFVASYIYILRVYNQPEHGIESCEHLTTFDRSDHPKKGFAKFNKLSWSTELDETEVTHHLNFTDSFNNRELKFVFSDSELIPARSPPKLAAAVAPRDRSPIKEVHHDLDAASVSYRSVCQDHLRYPKGKVLSVNPLKIYTKPPLEPQWMVRLRLKRQARQDIKRKREEMYGDELRSIHASLGEPFELEEDDSDRDDCGDELSRWNSHLIGIREAELETEVNGFA